MNKNKMTNKLIILGVDGFEPSLSDYGAGTLVHVVHLFHAL